LTRLLFVMEEPHNSQVISVIVRAGIAIPNRIQEVVHRSMAGTPFAWWMAVVTHFSKIPTLSVGLPQAELKIGWAWPDLFASSLSAIEAAELIGPQPEQLTILDGEWSPPMSKAEFGRRILQKRDARARDVDPIFDTFEKRPVKAKWSFRLDTLPEAKREKLVREPF